MVPDDPDQYPASPWQTIALFLVCGVLFGLAMYGAIELIIRASAWLPTG